MRIFPNRIDRSGKIKLRKKDIKRRKAKGLKLLL